MGQPVTPTRWSTREGDGDDYDHRFLTRAQAGEDVHGEARLVLSLGPRCVLDAGCGTGRVAVELARRGCDVVGVDLDPHMLAVARRKRPDLDWRLDDLGTMRIDDAHGARRRFDVIVAAGNVMIFLAPGSEAPVLVNLAAHLAPAGRLVVGFQLAPGGLDPATYDALAAAAGLKLAARWSTWDRAPFATGGDYAVSVHEGAAKH